MKTKILLAVALALCVSQQAQAVPNPKPSPCPAWDGANPDGSATLALQHVKEWADAMLFRTGWLMVTQTGDYDVLVEQRDQIIEIRAEVESALLIPTPYGSGAGVMYNIASVSADILSIADVKLDGEAWGSQWSPWWGWVVPVPNTGGFFFQGAPGPPPY